MRTWLHRHPNAAVAVLAVLWVVQVVTIGWNWAQGNWFLVVVGLAFVMWLTARLAWWWERT